MRVCPSCGSAYPDERDTCPLCDVPLRDQDKTQIITVPQRIPPEFHRPCPHCGQKVLVGLDRCPWCRRPLEGETARTPQEETAPPVATPPETAPDEKPTVYIDPRLMSFETMDTEETRIIERPSLEVPSEEAWAPPSPAETPAPPALEPVEPLPQPVRSPTPEAPLSTGRTPLPSAVPTAARIGWVVLVFGVVFGVGFSGYWLVRRWSRPERPSPPTPAHRPVAPPSKAEAPAPAVPAPPAMGRLVVNIQEPAQIYVDDALAATAPVAEIQVPAGTHRVRVVWLSTDKGPPPAPQEFTVEVAAGQAVTLPVTPPTPARLYVNSWPWSEVWIDGRRYGETPAVVTLPAGPHELEFRRPDGRSYRVPIELPPGGTLRVGYDFTSGQLWQNPPPPATPAPGLDRDGRPE
ncbi:hypothetical protein HRbin11_02055 [bacterium HR11]|nr:hypothetical protein HRbin11_02055 [bacterium HR11]